jgi:hypothetical protein
MFNICMKGKQHLFYIHYKFLSIKFVLKYQSNYSNLGSFEKYLVYHHRL